MAYRREMAANMVDDERRVQRSEDPDLARLRRARTLALRVLAVQVLVLVVTGAYLWFAYRPSAAQAWGRLYGIDGGVTLAMRIRTVHRWTSHLTVLTTVAVGALVAAEAITARAPRRPGWRAALGIPLLLVVLVASISGFLLPWDQLALKAVTVGSNMKGYGPIFGDQVRFVLIRGTEVSVATIQRWAIVHVLAGAATVSLLAMAFRRPRAEQPDPTSAPQPPAGPPAAPSS